MVRNVWFPLQLGNNRLGQEIRVNAVVRRIAIASIDFAYARRLRFSDRTCQFATAFLHCSTMSVRTVSPWPLPSEEERWQAPARPQAQRISPMSL